MSIHQIRRVAAVGALVILGCSVLPFTGTLVRLGLAPNTTIEAAPHKNGSKVHPPRPKKPRRAKGKSHSGTSEAATAKEQQRARAQAFGDDSATEPVHEARRGAAPHGFRDAASFAAFGKKLNTALRSAGYSEAQAFLRGSAHTGIRYERNGPGTPLGPEGPNDIDVAIASSGMMARAKEFGIGLGGGGTRTAPLNADQERKLGLTHLRSSLSGIAGRKVTFMIYDSQRSIEARGPYGSIPE